MSFIRPRNSRLSERSAGLRQELLGFLLSVTIWGAMVGLIGNTLFTVLNETLKDWAKGHVPAAVLLFMAVFGILVVIFLMALAHVVTGGMTEIRRFSLVIPLLYHEKGMEVVAIRGYEAMRAISAQFRKLRPKDWEAAVDEAVQENPPRPLGGRVHSVIAQSISRALLDTVCAWCSFSLSGSAEFHGLDYQPLLERGGPDKTIEVAGSGGKTIHLPPGCTARLVESEADRFGKRTERIEIRGKFGSITVDFFSQWAVLGPYHQLSLSFAKARTESDLRGMPDHSEHKRPSPWVLEIPVEMKVTLKNWRKPWFFLTREFQVSAAWICDFLDWVEERCSWEWYVDREWEREVVREELAKHGRMADGGGAV